jgi:hypothetical protein
MVTDLEALKKHIEELKKKTEVVMQTPEWEEYAKLKTDFDGFVSHMKQRRIDKLYTYVIGLIHDSSSYEVKVRRPAEDKIEEWLERLDTHRDKLYSNGLKKGHIDCESNVLDLLFEMFSKYGKKSDYTDTFTNAAYTLNIYTMEMYSGQGDYGYHIYKLTQVL